MCSFVFSVPIRYTTRRFVVLALKPVVGADASRPLTMLMSLSKTSGWRALLSPSLRHSEEGLASARREVDVHALVECPEFGEDHVGGDQLAPVGLGDGLVDLRPLVVGQVPAVGISWLRLWKCRWKPELSGVSRGPSRGSVSARASAPQLPPRGAWRKKFRRHFGSTASEGEDADSRRHDVHGARSEV